MKMPIILFVTIFQLFLGHAQAAQVETPEPSASLISRFTSMFYSPTVEAAVTPESAEISELPAVIPQAQAFDEGPSTSPPVWLFYNRFCATVGLDRNIIIGPLVKDAPGFYTLKVSILKSSIEKQDAWATLLVKEQDLGGAILNIIVLNDKDIPIKPKPFPDELLPAMKLIANALIDNPFYSSLQPGNPYFAFFIEFKKDIVQFYSDNMADCRRLSSEVAGPAFLIALNLESIKVLNIGISTAVE